jgi:hypothetical protein
LQGSEALPVKAVGDSSERTRFSGSMGPFEIQPTGDDKAYAIELLGGLWRLEGDIAIPVKIRPKFSGALRDSLPLGDLAGAFVQHERNRRKRQTPGEYATE